MKRLPRLSGLMCTTMLALGALAGAQLPLRLLTVAGLAVPGAIRRLWPLPARAVVLAATALVMAAGPPLAPGPVLGIRLVPYPVAAGCRGPGALGGRAAPAGTRGGAPPGRGAASAGRPGGAEGVGRGGGARRGCRAAQR